MKVGVGGWQEGRDVGCRLAEHHLPVLPTVSLCQGDRWQEPRLDEVQGDGARAVPLPF